MPPSSNPARTMRIDVPPTTIAARPRALAARAAAAAPAAPAFVARRDGRPVRDTPYDKLLASVYDAVLITDRQGLILDFNNRALEFFQIDEPSMPGRSVIDFISGADARLLERVRHNLEAYRYTVVEAYCSRADGTTFPSEIAINPIDLDANGQLTFFIRDITERTRAQQDLKHAVERLEALDRARLEFVSNVSHELRTPLTSMIYAVKNMQRGVAGPLPEKALQYLDRLNADCRRLLSTVNDILDLRQIENRTLTLTRSRIPLARLVEIGVESLRVQAEEKHIQLLMCRPETSGYVLCDAHKLERVVLNIVGNAIKFTPDGGSITVTFEFVAADTPQIVVRVRDTGIGIPPEAIDRIAVRYFKVGDQPIGSGLGLAISREIIELHGGKLLIESPVPGTDHGTQVSLILPLATPPHALVVSADAALYEQLFRFCREQGYPTTGLRDAHAIMQACRQNPPEILVLDQLLPDGPGLDRLLQLRNDRRTARLPMILVADDSLTRSQLDMLIALQIHRVPRPPTDQALVTAFNVIFYDRTLITERTGSTVAPSAATSPPT